MTALGCGQRGGGVSNRRTTGCHRLPAGATPDGVGKGRRPPQRQTTPYLALAEALGCLWPDYTPGGGRGVLTDPGVTRDGLPSQGRSLKALW